MEVKKGIISVTLACLVMVLPAAISADSGDGAVRINALVLPISGKEVVTQVPSFFEGVELGRVAMEINGGDVETNSPNVRIVFGAENAYLMQVSNGPGFPYAAWEPFQKSINWRLSPGDGVKTVYARFKTLSGFPSKIISASIELDTTPPANIDNFEAVAGDRQIGLKWINPPDSDFEGVLITRSEVFYPADPVSGTPVYIGKAESFTDSGLVNGRTYYYSAFSFDRLGNYASGSVAAANPFKEGGAEIEIPEIPQAGVSPEIEKLSFNNFKFIQDGKEIFLSGESKINIGQGGPFTIAIPYGDVPEVLKTIMVTLEKGGKAFSFILRINEEKTFYEATVVPPDNGVYPLTITILDYKNQAFKRIYGELIVAKSGLVLAGQNKYSVIRRFPAPIVYILIVLFSAAVCEIVRRIAKKKLSAKKKIRLEN